MSSIYVGPNIKTDFFIGTDQRKRFYFDRNATLSNIETILKKEDPTYQSIAFKQGETEVQDKDIAFIDAFLKRNLKIEINREVTPIRIDLNGVAGYINNTPYDNHMAYNEVPIYDSVLITNFAKVLQENLDKKFANKQSFDLKEVQEALEATIQNFKSKAEDKTLETRNTVEEIIAELAKEQTTYDELVNTATKHTNKILKYAIAATTLQWLLLFYLTYYEVGWDVVEPITYLIGLAIEGVGIYFYVRYAKSFRQKSIFEMVFKEKKLLQLKKKSAAPEVEIDYLKNKLNFFTQKLMYSKTQ